MPEMSAKLKPALQSVKNNKYVKSTANLCGRIFIFTVLASFLIPLSVLKVFDILLPRHFFDNMWVVLGAVTTPAVVAHVIAADLLEKKDESKQEKPSPRVIKIVYAFCALILIICIVIVVSRTVNENHVLNNAKHQFLVHVNGRIDEKSVDSTLIELRKQLVRLARKYETSVLDDPIRTELYPNIDSLQSFTGGPKWADAFVKFESGKPELYLPVERPPGDSFYKSSQESTPRPSHEIAHLVIFSKIGTEYIKELPLWFNEGVAQYESHRGFINKYRIIKKLDLWLSNIYEPNLLKDGHFILDSVGYPADDKGVYYMASFEFVTYLDSTRKGSLQRILQRLSIGETFAGAFEKEIGTSASKAYHEWYVSFF